MTDMNKNPLIKALADISVWLTENAIPYMVFGGVANSIYGDARQTFDVDFKIIYSADRPLDQFLNSLSSAAHILPEDPEQFISDTQVLPVQVSGVRVDLVFATLPFEIEAIERSPVKEVFGLKIHVCTPEDLIVQKAISTRDKDWLDIENLVKREKKALDWEYIEKHCSELAEFLDRPHLIRRIVKFKNG